MLGDESLEERMARIKRQNEELLKRHKLVEADKKRAQLEKAFVDTKANDDVREMTPAERLATLESRSRKPESLGNVECSSREHDNFSNQTGKRYSSHLTTNSTRWETIPPDNERFSRRQYRFPQRPKNIMNLMKKSNLVRMLQEPDSADVFQYVEPLNSTSSDDEKSCPKEGNLPQNFSHYNKRREHGLYSTEMEPITFSPPLQFHPDMDLSLPPPPIVKKQVYGSGRLNKSRLNSLPNLLPGESSATFNLPEPDFLPGFDPECYSPLNYQSLNELAKALDNEDPEIERERSDDENTVGRYRQESGENSWPAIGNFEDISNNFLDDSNASSSFQVQAAPRRPEPFLPTQTPQTYFKSEPSPPPPTGEPFFKPDLQQLAQSSKIKDNLEDVSNVWKDRSLPARKLVMKKVEPKKSSLQLRMDAVRQESCKRFSRAQYMAQDTSGSVDVSFVNNSVESYPVWSELSVVPSEKEES